MGIWILIRNCNRGYLCDKNMVLIFLYFESMVEVKFKDNGVNCLVEEILR